MAHKGHPGCPHNSKAACETARKIAVGQCSELVGDKDPHPCTRWGVDLIDGRPFCGQHITAKAIEAASLAARQAKQAAINARIEQYIAWREMHPSVWDEMPKENV
jgi:hypothetical protein